MEGDPVEVRDHSKACLLPEDVHFIQTLRIAFNNVSRDPGISQEHSRQTSKHSSIENVKDADDWEEKYEKFHIKSEELRQKIRELADIFERIGKIKHANFIKAMRHRSEKVKNVDRDLKQALHSKTASSILDLKKSMNAVADNLWDMSGTLNQRKHRFSFSKLQPASTAYRALNKSLGANAPAEENVHKIITKVIPELTIWNAGVAAELDAFLTRALPDSVNEEEESVTIRYLTLTTIATLFSSITATTLQFSYQQTATALDTAVNLLWFASLVFSVASGINSLLSMLWRRSTVYTEISPPSFINIWLKNAPVVFLAISALAFIVGLNIFTFSSKQGRVVSFVIITLTAVHVLGVVIMLIWFLIKLNWKTAYLQTMRRNFLWIFLHDGPIFELTYQILVATDWKQCTEPHKLVRAARRVSEGIRWIHSKSKQILLSVNTWLSESSKNSPYDFRGNLRSIAPKPLFDVFHLPASFRVTRMKAEDPESQRDDYPERAQQTEPIVIQDLVREIESTINDITRAALEQFKEESSLQRRVKDLFGKWKAREIPTGDLELSIKKLLWGYPQILKDFSEKVFPNILVVDGLLGKAAPETTNVVPKGPETLMGSSPSTGIPSTPSDNTTLPTGNALDAENMPTAESQLSKDNPKRVLASSEDAQQDRLTARSPLSECPAALDLKL